MLKTTLAVLSLLFLSTSVSAKMTMTNVYGPDEGKCGEFMWQVKFDLDNKSPAGGMFVQKIDYKKHIDDCNGKDIEKKEIVFWEAWTVSKDGTKPITRTKKVKYDDKYSEPECEDLPNQGKITITGKVNFFEGAALDNTYEMDNPKTIARGLPSTTTQPSYWTDADAIDHNLEVEWNCCNPKKKKKTVIKKKVPAKKAPKKAPKKSLRQEMQTPSQSRH